jgi:proteasome lid subunit RPN8/RPN11
MATIGLSDDGLLEAASGSGSLVRFASSVLEQIRLEALDKFLSIPRGGLEIGGVLFGTIAGSEVRVLALRALAIEYRSGPSFVLSSDDEVSLAGLLETPNSDPALKGMQPVGWYHSHTRTGVSLSEQDIAIHHRFFPLPEQIALVIKPFKFEPSQVGIFAREADGSLRGDAPFSRFPLEPRTRGTKAAAEAPAPSLSSPGDAQTRPVMMKAAAQEREWAGLAESEPWWRFPIQTAKPRPSGAWKSRLAIAAIVVMVAAAAAVTYVQNRPVPTEDSGPIRLQLDGAGDKLTIVWNPRSLSLARARSAELIISDGDQRPATIPLDKESLERGTLTYFRQSGSVEVRMRVQSQVGRALEEVVHFAGPPPAVQPAPVVEASRDEPDPEMRRIKAELERLKTEISLGLPDQERARSDSAVRPPTTALSPGSKIEPVARRQFIAPKAAADKQPANNAVDVRPPAITSQVQLSSTILPGATPQPPHYQPVPPPAPVPQQKPAAGRAASGRAIWTGRLPKGALLLFEGARPSVGSLHGSFPQNAARIRVYAADLDDAGIVVFDGGARQNAIEPPSAANGWNLTTYNADAKRFRSATVLEYPSQNNDWKRLLIRSEDRTLSMLVIDWEEFP